MSKGLLDFSWKTPVNAWKRATVNPIGSTLAMSAAAAIPAYFLAPWLGRKFINTAVPEKYRAEAMEEFEQPENLRRLRGRAAGIAALLTGMAHLYTSYTPARGMSSLASWGSGLGGTSVGSAMPKNASLMSKQALQYYMSAPAFSDTRTGFSSVNAPAGMMPAIPLNANTAPLFGMGSAIGGDVDALIETPIVPLRHAEELIENDPYLNPRQKGIILNIFDKTDTGGRSGLVSVSDLASAGVRAGLGYAGGAAAGLVLGSIFGLPTSVTQQLSRVGGIANAVINTGIVGI